MENSIIHGDCLEVMKDIADKSIDCIIADLPYGMVQCKWDSVIPFDLLWKQYERIIKPNGAIVLFGTQPFTSALVMSNPKWFKYEWIWEKNLYSNFLNAKRQPLKSHENILIFYKNQPTFNRIYSEYSESTRLRYPNGGTPKPGSNITHNCYKEIAKIRNPLDMERGRSPISRIKADCVHNGNNTKLHPTQKPTQLLEYLLKTYSLEGELVLDNTAGSGSLAIAAINTNRKYICIEKDPHYFEVMENRIANHDPNAPAKKAKVKPVSQGQLELW